MKIEDIAKICHEANKALCESQGDFTQAQWNVAEPWQRASVVAGVQQFIDEPKATPETMHESWLEMKIAEGWQYGETKDARIKRHPCMVPYADLSKEQQTKDSLFLAICANLTPQASKVVPAKAIPAVKPTDTKVKMNPADAEAIGMDLTTKPGKAVPKPKVLPSGKAMPIVKGLE